MKELSGNVRRGEIVSYRSVLTVSQMERRVQRPGTERRMATARLLVITATHGRLIATHNVARYTQ